MGLDSKKANFIDFSKAKLVLVNKTSSYLELSAEDLNNNKCLFCPKSTSHDHDITGKLKFDPKLKAYLISILLDKKTQTGLEVIPIKRDVKNDTPEEPSKFKHVYPKLVPDEESGAKYFAEELYKSHESVTDSVTAAIRIKDESMHLLNGTPKSLLKKISNCDKCLNNDFQRLVEVQQHYEKIHHYTILIRDVTIKEDKNNAMKIQDIEEDESFKCQFCDKCFRNDQDRTKHANDVHVSSQETQLQCPTCLQIFKHLNSYKKHITEHFKKRERKHKCHLCNKSFLKPAHLRAHVQMHMGAKTHPCDVCDKRFTSLYALKSHLTNIHGIGEKPNCHLCQKTFYNKSLVKKHILEHHQKDSRLECKQCGQFYLRKDNLENHIQSVHGPEKHPCKLCSKSYACKERLQDHLRTSHGILPWNKVQVLQTVSKPHEDEQAEVQKELEGTIKCRYCEQVFLPAEMENHLRFSHGVMPIRPGTTNAEISMSDAAEALLKTLTPQIRFDPDYLLRSLTPLPMETLDEYTVSTMSDF